jgi:hypothetical protein
MYDFVYEDWTNVTATENTYTATGLTPESEYEWQIQGVNASCGTLDWSEIQNFTTLEYLGQVLALESGWTWCSFNVSCSIDDLKAALVNALPGTAMQIKSKTETLTYNGSRWRGVMNTIDVAQMYRIKTTAATEITLPGEPVVPAEHPITINTGANWIAYPLTTSMSVADAFAGFATRGDQIKSKSASSTYTNRWRGDVQTLEPGQGYVYKSATDRDPFTFPTPSKSAPRTAVQTVDSSARKNVKTKTFDLILPRK